MLWVETVKLESYADSTTAKAKPRALTTKLGSYGCYADSATEKAKPCALTIKAGRYVDTSNAVGID